MIHFNARWQCENMVRALKDQGYKFPVYNFHEGKNNTETKQYIKKSLSRLAVALLEAVYMKV